MLGTALGTLIGLGFAILANALALGDLFAPPGWTLGPAMTLAGGLGGWLMAPLAWRARGFGEWLGTVALFAMLAVLLGDAIVVGMIAGSQLISPSSTAAVAGPLGLAAGAIELFVFGLIIVGPFAGVATLAAATVWAVAMRLVRGRVASG